MPFGHPFRAYRGRGIPAGGSAAFQAALLKNDPLDHSYQLRRRSGSNPFMHAKKDALQASFFMCTGEEGFEPTSKNPLNLIRKEVASILRSELTKS